MKKVGNTITKNEKIGTFLIALILGISWIMGNCIDINEGIFHRPELGHIGIGVAIILVSYIPILFLIQRAGTKKCIRNYNTTIKQFLILVMILLVTWLPAFFSYYPGNISRDTYMSLLQVTEHMSWSNHHPIIFTLLLKIIYTIMGGNAGNLTLCVGIMTLFQMFFFATSLIGMLCYCLEYSNKRWVKLLTVGFVFANPIITLFAIELGKDTFFCGWMIWYVLVITNIIQEKEQFGRKSFIQWMFVSFMVMFSRSNGVFIVILTSFVLIAFLKKKRKNFSVGFTSLVLTYLIVTKMIFPMMNITSPSFAEAATVPIQQIAYSMKNDGSFSQDDIEYLTQIMSVSKWKENYSPTITDTIKFSEDFNNELFNKTKLEFLKSWFNGLAYNFPEYVQAYLLQTHGYWRLDAIPNVSNLVTCENELGLTQTDFIKEKLGISIKPIYYYGMQAFRKLPVLRLFMNQFLLALLLIAIQLGFLFHKKASQMIGFIPLDILWVTLMLAAPLSTQFRYLGILYLLLPFLIVYGIGRRKE